MRWNLLRRKVLASPSRKSNKPTLFAQLPDKWKAWRERMAASAEGLFERAKDHRTERRVILRLEGLEERVVPATQTVNSSAANAALVGASATEVAAAERLIETGSRSRPRR